jgi:hypothetical protein
MVAVLAVVSVAQQAHALSIWAEHDGGVAIAGLPGYLGYTVYLKSDDPANPAGGWAGSFDGPMNQLKIAGTIDTPTRTLSSALGAEEPKDSHFLLFDADMLIATAPSESAVHLDGIFGIGVAARQQDLPFAYLVIADGDQVAMSGQSSDPDGQQAFDTNIVIPEPASLMLLGLGGMGVLLRRRR